MNKVLVTLLICLSFISFVSSISVNYYYHPECGHCKNIAPFMQKIINEYDNVKWNILDTSKGSYRVEGTPYLILRTDDSRNIELKGSHDIPRYLQCELDEQSNLNCPTYSASECRNDSWFIKE